MQPHRPRTARTGIAVLLLGACAIPALAEVRDRYQQSTRVLLEDDQIKLIVELTAGIGIVSGIVTSIDRDSDGIVTPEESREYARQVADDLAVTLDGKPMPLRVAAVEFPAQEQLESGLGLIRVTLAARTDGGSGSHELVVENRHAAKISDYHADVLPPASPAFRVLNQYRSADQATYKLTYRETRAPAKVLTAS